MQAIIIPGSYRSGSSYIARAIHAKGVPMYTNLVSEGCEDSDILMLNKEELKRNPPDDTADTPYKWKPTPGFVSRLHDLKAKRESAGKPYGFKEPQIGVLIRAYLVVWPEAHWIVCRRNGLSAWWSQKRRHARQDNTSELEGMRLHDGYIYNMTEMLRRYGCKTAFFNYDGNIWDEEKNLREFTGLDLKIAGEWKRKEQRRYPA